MQKGIPGAKVAGIGGVFAEAAEMKCDELRGNNRMF